MLRLGIIGTNWISERFMEAAKKTKRYRTTALYSRTTKSAQTFLQKTNGKEVKIYTNFLSFVQSKEVDVVYIASPNRLHFEQAKQCILHGKHIIVEKPAFLNEKETKEIIALSKEKHVKYFEALRHLYEPGVTQLKQLIQNEMIQGAHFHFCQYSSRYALVLNNQEPNIFSLYYGGGALMDLGVYLISFALFLFGQPLHVRYDFQKIKTGVDGSGVLHFTYPNFLVTMHCSKTYDSTMPNEIYTTTKTICFPHVTRLCTLQTIDHQKKEEQHTLDFCEPAMQYEAEAFATCITEKDQKDLYEQQLKWSLLTSKWLTKARYQAHLYFTDELKKEKNDEYNNA